MEETLAEVYHLNEVFWLGLVAVVLGVLTPVSLAFGGLNVSSWFIVTGGGLLVTSVFVGIYRFSKPTENEG
ncbi:hypothetical protein [Halorubrum sp. FL23]|uniref:hypothetical protein n=1 Tax=Halorubrum sp. FL23 TaxID=3458704 RepID=UPI004034209E